MTEGKIADRASKSRPDPPLSSRSESATVDIAPLDQVSLQSWDQKLLSHLWKRWNYFRDTTGYTLTVFPIKPWTLKKISGMFIVSRPIRCEMKPQKITDKPQQGAVTTWYKTTSWLFLLQEMFNSLWISLKKLSFDHKPTPVPWFRLFKNQSTE